jgi:very-short-patch-repair endonuclease
MRVDMPDSERRLWDRLRYDRPAGRKFTRQVPIGPFIADFACRAARFVIEIDGDEHGKEDQQLRDARRTEWLESHGWRVIRFWSSELTSNNIDWVIERIEEELFK